MRIGNINHEYGHLEVKEEDGKYYWSITASTFSKWEEISKFTYTVLLRHERRSQRKKEDS